MGCGASTPSPPSGSKAIKPAPATVELILVLGVEEASGKSKLCEQLCESLRASGRSCQHLDLQSLLKAEVAAETEVGLEVASLVGQGKIVPAALSARVVKAALQSSPPGIHLLEGYPPSEAALKSIADDVGHAPRLALLLDMDEKQAKAKLTSSGHDEQSAEHAWMMFRAQSKGLLEELERRSILHKLDTTKSESDVLSAARALVDGVTRGTAPAAGGSGSGASHGGGEGAGSKMVLVMGGPGAGKATHCAGLAKKYGCVHLDLQVLMQTAVREETETGKAIAEMVKGGKIVPAHLYMALVKAATAKLPDGGKLCLLDGFPRSVDSLALMEEHLGPCKHAMLLDASDALLEQRLLQRASAAGRAEDPEAAKRKIRTFRNQTQPAISTLQARGMVSKIDASGSKEDVFKRLCKAYEALGHK